jgi:hypothetical protein
MHAFSWKIRKKRVKGKRTFPDSCLPDRMGYINYLHPGINSEDHGFHGCGIEVSEIGGKGNDRHEYYSVFLLFQIMLN